MIKPPKHIQEAKEYVDGLAKRISINFGISDKKARSYIEKASSYNPYNEADVMYLIRKWRKEGK